MAVSFQAGTTVPWMDEAWARVTNAGIGLFEMRLPEKIVRDKYAYGPYSVRVHEDEDYGGRTRVRVEWLTHDDAYLHFYVDDKGINLGWMPDDPWWHNRIHLMDSPLIRCVYNLHTKQGTIPGSVVFQEIEAMRKILKTLKPIFRVIRNGKELEFHYRKDEAEARIKELTMVAPKFDPATGQMVAMQARGENYKIEKGEILDYRPEVEQIISHYRGLEHGWTESDEFRQNYMPKILAEIKKIRENNTGAAPQVNALTMVRSMTPEQIDELRAILAGGAPASAPSTPSPVEIPSVEALTAEPLVSDAEVAAAKGPTVAVAPDAPVQKYEHADLIRMTVPGLKQICESLGVFVEGMKRTDMLSAIVKAQKTEEVGAK
jgi:hypothetical protein